MRPGVRYIGTHGSMSARGGSGRSANGSIGLSPSPAPRRRGAISRRIQDRRQQIERVDRRLVVFRRDRVDADALAVEQLVIGLVGQLRELVGEIDQRPLVRIRRLAARSPRRPADPAAHTTVRRPLGASIGASHRDRRDGQRYEDVDRFLVQFQLRALRRDLLQVGGNLFAEHRRVAAVRLRRRRAVLAPLRRASRRPRARLMPLASTGIVSVRTCAAAAITRSAAASAASSCGESSAGTSTRSGTRSPIASSAPSVVSARISSAPTWCRTMAVRCAA